MRARGVALAVFVSIVLSGHARGQEAPVDTVPNAQPDDKSLEGRRLTTTLGVSTAYVGRGILQTDGVDQIYGSVDLVAPTGAGDVYAGAWASNVDYAFDDTSAEVDLYAGFRPRVADFDLDLGLIAYLYVDQPPGGRYDYVEAKLAASRALGPATVGVLAYASPDFFGEAEEEALYVELNGTALIGRRLTASGALGRQETSTDFDYATWNAGLSWVIDDRFTLDVRWHDTDRHDLGDAFDGRAVATLRATL